MPFKNNQYEPNDRFKRNMRGFIAAYLKIDTHRCKQNEFEEMLFELRSMETEFFESFDSLNIKQDWQFEEKRNIIAKAMKDFAVPRILNVLNELYKQRHKSKTSVMNKPTKIEIDIATNIWKERYKERERCPRGGVIIIVDGQVILVKYGTGDCTNYGHSKGKIEYNETIQECAAREAEEELGLPSSFVYDLIKDQNHIKKDVRYKYDGLSQTIEHYYFIIVISATDYCRLRPNKHEIDDIERRDIDTLPCCKKCSENLLMEYNDESEEHESNYYMVSCTNFTAASSLIQDIIKFVDEKNGNGNALKKYNEKHRYCQLKDTKNICYH